MFQAIREARARPSFNKIPTAAPNPNVTDRSMPVVNPSGSRPTTVQSTATRTETRPSQASNGRPTSTLNTDTKRFVLSNRKVSRPFRRSSPSAPTPPAFTRVRPQEVSRERNNPRVTKKGHQEARTNRNGKPLKGLSEIAMPLDDFFDLVTKNSYPDIAHEYGYTVASVRGLVTVRVTEKALRDGVSRHAVKQSINLDRAIHGVIKNPRRGNIRARTEVPLFGVRSSRPGVPASAQSERSMPEHWRIIAADASDQQSPGALDITPDSVASSSTKSNTNSANTSRREQLKQEYHTTYAKKYDKIEATKARGEQPSRERYDSLIEQHERLAAIKREIETELGTQKEPTEAEDVPRTPGYAMPDTPGVPCMPGAGVSAGIDYGTPRTPGYAMPDTPGVPCLLTRDYQVIQAPQAKASTNNLGGRKQGKTAVTPRTPEYSPDGDFTAWNLSENFSRDDFNEGKSSPKRPADFYDEPFVSEDEWLEQYCKG